MTAGGLLVITHPASLLHGAPGHPERPERIEAIEAALAGGQELARLPRLTPEPARREQVEAVHHPGYVAAIVRAGEEAEASGQGGWLDPDTWIGPGSLEAAFAAAGGAVAAVESVLDGRCRNAFSLCRPPGHHATREGAMGFCIFNNIAVGAEVALARGLRRMAILDFDVHHGNGTEDVFLERADVYYMSCHQWPLYPMTGTTERGRGAGEGYTLNAPMSAGAGLDDYLEVFDGKFAPALRDYAPELLLVSAGFDAHERDPLAGMKLTTGDYGVLASRILRWATELCEGRTVWCLEGGYDLTALAESVSAVLRTSATT